MIRGVIGATSSAFSAAGHGNRPAIVLIGFGNVGSGIDCRSLLLLAASFRRQLHPDHLPDELMFVAQEQHHLSGRGDRLVRSLSCVPPLGCHRKSAYADHKQSRRQQTFRLGHAGTPLNRFKHVIEIQTCVLEKGRAAVGKICDFFGAEILPPRGTAGRCRRGRLTESAGCVATHMRWLIKRSSPRSPASRFASSSQDRIGADTGGLVPICRHDRTAS